MKKEKLPKWEEEFDKLGIKTWRTEKLKEIIRSLLKSETQKTYEKGVEKGMDIKSNLYEKETQ